MKEFVIALLKKNIPPFYYYHNYEHTLYVMSKAVEIAQHEHCTAKETGLVSTAALWHDTGFIHVYENHEEESCALAKKFLPEYGYSMEDIDTICGLIMATKIPQSPKNKLEKIIVDADLEYLGTDKAFVNAENLFMEIQHINPVLTRKKWDEAQILFLQHHHYYTVFCKKNREPAKLLYLNKLINEAAMMRNKD